MKDRVIEALNTYNGILDSLTDRQLFAYTNRILEDSNQMVINTGDEIQLVKLRRDKIIQNARVIDRFPTGRQSLKNIFEDTLAASEYEIDADGRLISVICDGEMAEELARIDSEEGAYAEELAAAKEVAQ